MPFSAGSVQVGYQGTARTLEPGHRHRKHIKYNENTIICQKTTTTVNQLKHLYVRKAG